MGKLCTGIVVHWHHLWTDTDGPNKLAVLDCFLEVLRTSTRFGIGCMEFFYVFDSFDADPSSTILRFQEGRITNLLTDFGQIKELMVTKDEIENAQLFKIGLDDHQIRGVHAQVYANILGEMLIDGEIDDKEARYLKGVSAFLDKLGWAP